MVLAMTRTRHEVFRERAQANPRCPECVIRADSPEVYTVTRYRDNALLAFDIELAQEFCRDGRAPVLLSADILDVVLKVNAVTADHVGHVDPSYPGISCPVDVTSDGQPVLGLIDGSHRAARCRRDGLPYWVFELTVEEAQRCQDSAAARVAGFLEMLLRNSAAV
jgi:hypothetical protein